MSQSISAILPVYNGARYLRDCINSVLDQTVPVSELIVIDDGSNDSSAEIVASYHDPRIVCLFQTNRGTPAARNRGLGAAKGELIAFIDVDDVWPGDKIQTQLPYLLHPSPVDLCIGRCQRIQDHGAIEAAQTPTFRPSLGAGLFRRTVFERVGAFNEQMKMDDDVDWFLRAKELGVEVRSDPEVVYYVRRHEDNLSRDRDADEKYFLRALHASLHRRGGTAIPSATPGSWPF